MSSSGFENAPVSLVIVTTTFLASFLWGGNANSLGFDLRGLLVGQFSRLLTSKLIFSNMGETFVGCLLCYNLRTFERYMGSRKFGAFVAVSMVLSTLGELAIASLLYSLQVFGSFESGPFFFIFALLPMFYWYIPKIYGQQATVTGVTVHYSEKSFIYALALQLCFCKGMASIIPSLVGLFAGVAYASDSFGIQFIRLPVAVENGFGFAGRFITSLIPTPSTQPVRAPGNAGMRPRGPARTGAMRLVDSDSDMWQHYGYQDDAYGAAGMGNMGGAPPQPPAPPSEDAIIALTGLGFERDAVVQALQRTDNNVEAAANLLLR